MIWRWTLNKTNFGPIAEFIGEGLSVLSLKRFGCSSLNYRLCVCHWGFIYWVVKNFTQMKTLKQCPELGWVRAWNHLGWCGIKSLVHCKVTEEGTFPSWGTNSATSTVAWLRCGCCGVCGQAVQPEPAQPRGSTAVSVPVQLHSLGTARTSLTSPHNLNTCSVAWFCLILPSCNHTKTQLYP